eukprot:jgi/Mesen1/10524/ME000083S10028
MSERNGPEEGGAEYQSLASGPSSLQKPSLWSRLFFGGYTKLLEREDASWCPEEEAGLASRATFSWVTGLMWLGNQKVLHLGDLWSTAPADSSVAVGGRLEHVWQAEQLRPRPSLARALFRSFGWAFARAGVLKLVYDGLQFSSPMILQRLVRQLQQPAQRSVRAGLALTALLLLCNVVQSLCIHSYFHIVYRVSMNVRAAVISLIYKKALRITAASRQSTSLGEILNLQSNDAQKLGQLCIYLHILWSGPLQIFGALALLFYVIKVIPALSGLGAMLLLLPFNGLMMRYLAATRKRVLAATDARVKLVSEVVGGIKAIKLYAWEGPFRARIDALRDAEMRQITISVLIGARCCHIISFAPTLVSVASLSVYTLMGNTLDASVAFPALALFNVLRFPLAMLPDQIIDFVQARVSAGRIQKFLVMPETVPLATASGLKPGTVKIEEASFEWSVEDEAKPAEEGQNGKEEKRATLSGINMEDPWIQNATLQGNILMGAPLERARYERTLDVCALRDDLRTLPAGDQTEIGEKGINLSGGQKHRVALARAVYADCDIYLLDDPLSAVDTHVGRHLFDQCICGALKGKTRVLVTHQLQYVAAADAIAVVADGTIEAYGTYDELRSQGIDFEMFGDDSEDEEEEDVDGGADDLAVLKEGQVAAVINGHVAPSETVIVSHEAAQIGGPCGPDSQAAGSTEIVVTVRRQMAAQEEDRKAEIATGGHDIAAENDDEVSTPSRVTRLDAVPPRGSSGGSGRLSGSFTSSGRLSGSFKRQAGGKKKKDSQHGGTGGGQVAAGKDTGKATGVLTEQEMRSVGQVKLSVYAAYLRAWGGAARGGGYLMPLLVVLCYTAAQGAKVGNDTWLAAWTRGIREGRAPVSYYLSIYALTGLLTAVLSWVRGMLLAYSCVAAARTLHAQMVARVLRLPMAFFDSQPMGRLINRFTHDTEQVDLNLPDTMLSFLSCLFQVVFAIGLITVVTPLFVVPMVPLLGVYYGIQRFYLATSRELKRLDALARSPIFAHFGETVQGLTTIRAFRQQARFAALNDARLDDSTRAYFASVTANRWLGLRLEMLGALAVFATGFFCVATRSLDAAFAGLALTNAFSITSYMSWMVRMNAEIETEMNSVERVLEYTQLPPEAPTVVERCRPPPGWPFAGAIAAVDVVVQYRPDLEPVLKGLSFTVEGGEKVGVCGRTGCGKTTLMMALYRIMELKSGRIVIDGVDVSTLGLHDLRSRLALVPQDPVVFSGSVRDNLDPFREAEAAGGAGAGAGAGGDVALWEALERAGLRAFVEALPGKLDAEITEGGSNLSTGQRQLMCMGRALLRKTRILVLDEATSNVDGTTDAIIQATIRDAFRHCTVLTIAHRLHTIIDSDKVLLLEDGRLAESGTPAELLAAPASRFSGFVDQTLPQQAASLRKMAVSKSSGNLKNVAKLLPSGGE